MFNWFKKKFSLASIAAQPAVSSSHVVSQSHPVAPTIPVYPPVDIGIEVTDVDTIINSQQEMMGRLRILAGGNDEHYKRYYETVVRNLAAYVQLLPASKSETHNGAGGLFRLCLEIGFFSLQSAERIVFAGQTNIELRRELEPRWRYATFLAALCCELYRPLSDMVVTDQEGKSWPKYLKSLTDWTTEQKKERYFVQWHNARPLHTLVSGRADVAVVMRAILPDYTLQYLEDAAADIVPVVFAVASGSAHPTDNPTSRIINETRNKIFKRDTAVRKDNYGQLTVGNHLEPYILDAMRHLHRNGTWKINAEKSRLWLSSEGLFLIWKSGAKEILKTLTENGVAGAPQDILTLAEILCDAKIATRNGTSSYWMVTPPSSNDEWQAIKFANPMTILEDDEIELVKLEIRKEGSAPKKEEKAVAELIQDPVKPKPKTKTVTEVIEKKKDPIDAQRDLSGFDEDSNANDPALPAQPNLVVEEVASKVLDQKPKGEKSRLSDKPRFNQPDLDAEIAPVLKQNSYGSQVSEEAAAGLKSDVREVIGKMIDDYKKGRHKQLILDVPQGIAIESQQVLRYGLSFDRIVGLMHTNDWLESPPGNPNAKNMKVPGLDGKPITCIIIKRQAADFLGFLERAS